MKKLLVAILCFSTFLINAQENQSENKSIEIGFNVANFTRITVPSFPEKNLDNVYFMNGIFLKRHFEKKTLRLGYENYRGTVKIKDYAPLADTFNTSGTYSQNFFFVGMQKYLLSKKVIQLYFGADLNLYTANYDGNTTHGFSSFNTTKLSKGISLSPLLGISANLAKCIRLSLECCGSLLCYLEDENTSYLPSDKLSNQNQTLNFTESPLNSCKLGISFLF